MSYLPVPAAALVMYDMVQSIIHLINHTYRANLAAALHMAKGKRYETDFRCDEDGNPVCGCEVCRDENVANGAPCSCPRCSLISLFGEPTDGRFDGIAVYGNLTGSRCCDLDGLEAIHQGMRIDPINSPVSYLPVWQTFGLDGPTSLPAMGDTDHEDH